MSPSQFPRTPLTGSIPTAVATGALKCCQRVSGKRPCSSAIGTWTPVLRGWRIPRCIGVCDCGGSHTWHDEGVKKWPPNQKISRKGAVRQAHGPERSRRAKPQRSAKKLKEFELAFLCALAPLREAVDFFTASLHHVCATRGGVGGMAGQPLPYPGYWRHLKFLGVDKNNWRL